MDKKAGPGTPINRSEQEEKLYLAEVRERLQHNLNRMEQDVRDQSRELKEVKEYLYEHKAGMDRMEKYAVRQSVIRGAIFGEESVKRRDRIEKLLDSPYFGRFDFGEGRQAGIPVYIGIHSFIDITDNANLIHDWRAPVSSMFYDFELGDAHYEAPAGIVSGTISLKRQYRIRGGVMEYMLENAAQVYDDILQQELSKASDEKMKNIVATIQRDQNPIIRDETSQVLIIQGVAGSGKTSIALHRIAFLLYRFKDIIKAKNILIISPNKVYADYIASVLPELGEERIPEMGMEDLARLVLGEKVNFQSFHEQMTLFLEKNDTSLRERVGFKSTHAFVAQLEDFILHIENEYLSATDLWIGKSLVPAWFIEEHFKSLHRLPIMKRFPAIVQAMEDNIRLYYKREISTIERQNALKAITGMFRMTNTRMLYKAFFQWLGQAQLYKQAARSRLEYADVFPLIYLKTRLEGFKQFETVKHLLVDEMQDYTPVQYALLARLFPGKKTILGDGNQKLNPFGSSTALDIRRVFPESDLVKLCRSYRSTCEITAYAQKILPDPDLIAVERHGAQPITQGFEKPELELSFIIRQVEAFRHSGYHSMGIICKTGRQARELHAYLEQQSFPCLLLDEQSHSFSSGLMVTTIAMAKGLEFDQVLVPFVTRSQYHTDTDRHLLYIACTRAMHALVITYTEKSSKFIHFTTLSPMGG